MFKKLIGLIVLILLVFSGFYVYRMHENVKHVMSYEVEVEKSLKAQGLVVIQSWLWELFIQKLKENKLILCNQVKA